MTRLPELSFERVRPTKSSHSSNVPGKVPFLATLELIFSLAGKGEAQPKVTDEGHIVRGGFGGLAAAALLIQNADVSGHNITIYRRMTSWRGFFLEGDAEHGYNLPGTIFDKEPRYALDLLQTIPTLVPQHQCRRAASLQ